MKKKLSTINDHLSAGVVLVISLVAFSSASAQLAPTWKPRERGALEKYVFRSDPVTNSDETGTFFYLSLLQTFCENMYRSSNGGQSWTELQADGLAEGGDKQWFTIDKTNGPGHGFQYQSSDGINCAGGGVQFQRSTDGGVTWQSRIVIPQEPTDGTLDVDTNGNLVIGGAGFGPFDCVRSSNAQSGGQTPTFDQVTQV